MTLLSTQDTGSHLGELRLRRFRAGELDGPAADEISRHAAECGQCRARLRLLQEEERQFQRDIPFERFAGGVERALRVPRPKPRRTAWLAGGGFGLAAAAAALLLLVRPAPGPSGQSGAEKPPVAHGNRSKGSTSALARIAGAAGEAQRALLPDGSAALKAGDRIRLGYAASAGMHLLALSVDDAGEVTALYPERGSTSLQVGDTRGTTYLPDSLELTGTGRERVFLFLAERPIDLEAARQAVRMAHRQARGDLEAVAAPALAGRSDVRQFSWLFHKP
jgi:hypothetical protein